MALPFEEKLRRFPPVVCRCLARVGSGHSTRLMSDEEISQVSGLSLSEVMSLGCKTSWDNVPVESFVRFTKGCGIDIDSRDSLAKHSVYLNKLKGAPKYLRKDPAWKTRWKPAIVAFYTELSSAEGSQGQQQG